jgi:hypothetical protein
MFQTKVVEEIKTRDSFFSLKNHAIIEIMWRTTVVSGLPRTTIRHMRIACWLHKTRDTHSEYVTLIAYFHYNNGCTNASQCYVIRTMPVLIAPFQLYLSDVVLYVSKSGVNLKVGIAHLFQVFSFLFLPCLLRESC